MANLITLLRTLLAFLVAAMLHVPRREIYVAAIALTLLLIWMDALDGWVARRLGEASKFGAVIDILGDRVVEMTYWIVFVALGWLPVWVALLVAARGILVDGLRSIALERGLTAFGATSMMKTKIGAALVASRTSRALYGVGKALAFSLLILLFTPGIRGYFGDWLPFVALGVYAITYATIALCVVRGVPVLVEARRLI
jgi:CDP-diacylglycerol---glycerol-3-phosphate 3-phosphatidyltransferase